MKSSYESQKHRELRATKEALREHARWQISTGKTPTQIIGILKGHGCFDAENFLRRLWNKELETQDKQVIRKIPASSIPPVTPVQKPEEPKRSVKHTQPWEPKVPYVSWDRIARGARPGDSGWSKHQDDTVFANPKTEVPAGRSYFSETKTLESVPT